MAPRKGFDGGIQGFSFSQFIIELYQTEEAFIVSLAHDYKIPLTLLGDKDRFVFAVTKL